MRRVSEAGVALIKTFEGLRLKSYLCSAGHWTIGWGSTEGVRAGMSITEETAERLFQADLQKHASGVEKLLKTKVTDEQFAAMVSLAFNVGVERFATSTLLKCVNAGRFDLAAEQFLVWNKERHPETKQLVLSRGLARRREAERLLFLGRVAAL